MTTQPETLEPPEESLLCAARIAHIMDSLKASDVLALDLRGVADIADFFVIGTVQSAPQMKGLAWKIVETLKAAGIHPASPVEDESPRWTIIDYGDVVAHLFDPEARKLYQLEQVWGDAGELTLEGELARLAPMVGS